MISTKEKPAPQKESGPAFSNFVLFRKYTYATRGATLSKAMPIPVNTPLRFRKLPGGNQQDRTADLLNAIVFEK